MGSGRSLPLWAVATAETTVNRRVDCLPVLIPQAFPVLEIHVSLALWFCVSCQHTSSLLLRPTDTGFHWVTWPVEYEWACQCPQVQRPGLHRHCIIPLALVVCVTILVKGMVPALCGSFGVAPGMRQVRAKPDPGLRAKPATLQPETESSLPTYRPVS